MAFPHSDAIQLAKMKGHFNTSVNYIIMMVSKLQWAILFNAIILQWHALDRSEQARFYEMARRERALHMQMYPNWSARSNYASTNKKKRKRDKAAEQGKAADSVNCTMYNIHCTMLLYNALHKTT